MADGNAPRFFLGANSKNGFASLYDGWLDPAAGDFLWVIKGSPGCGKSSFMKRVGAAAERAGLRPEYILCSGDPDSLDGVYFPALHTAYVDGTAPHVLEAVYPGAASLYLDLSGFLDAGALRERLPEIMELNRRYKACYDAAYAQLAAAAALLPKNCPALSGNASSRALLRRIGSIAARELRTQKKASRVSHRFLSAISCQGRLLPCATLEMLCTKICVLDNELGLGHEALSLLDAAAAAQGCDRIVCHDPLEPEKTEALILPELSLGFLAAGYGTPAPKGARRIRLDARAVRELTPENRALLRQRRTDSRTLLLAATETLAEAKRLHDKLEAVYHPHVDFAGVDALAEEHVRRLLDGAPRGTAQI